MKQRKDYVKKIIFSHDDFKEKGHVLQLVTIPPKTKQRLHFHHRETEIYYIIEGSASVLINDQEFAAKLGDAFITEPNDKHLVHNKSDKDFKLVVFKINMPKDNDDTFWIEK